MTYCLNYFTYFTLLNMCFNYCYQVNMKEGFLLPPVTLDWKKFHCPAATSWMLGFAGYLQHWKLLTLILA